MTAIGRRILRLMALCIAALLVVSSALAEIDLQTVARISPRTQIVCEVTFAGPLTRDQIPRLRELELRSAVPPRELVGRESAVFITQARTALALDDPLIAEWRWLPTHQAGGLYSIHFQYVGEETLPALTFTVAAPRSATGRELTSLAARIDPPAPLQSSTDGGGNRFLTLAYHDVRPGQQLLFDFAVGYEFDTAAIVLGCTMALGPTPMPESWPEEVLPFLEPGFHIESDHPEIVAAAEPLATSDRLDERIRAVLRFVGRTVTYDTAKRDGYFGGRFTYRDAWEMWQGAVGTLRRGEGCCPDSAELKVALLRAAGIPARTAVHNGHLYAEAWVPGHGWLTDGPMSKIPLLRAPGPDNISYMAWEPEVPVRCAAWRGQLRPLEPPEAEGEGWIALPIE